jgi:hypothetical protein
LKKYWLGLFIFFTAAVTHTVSAVEYGGIGGRPAYPRADNSRTESIFIHTLEPGNEVKDGVRVINNSSQKKTLLVYPTDSAVSSGGAFACAQKVDERKSVGGWIALDKTEVTLEPSTNEVVDFSIKVPLNADVGENNGCIVVEEKKADDQADQTTGNISLGFRTAMRVAVLIPGELTRKLEIVGFRAEPNDKGSVNLIPSVKNTGNVSADAQIEIETRHFFGLLHYTHQAQYPITRGSVAEWNFELPKPKWGGFFRSQAIVKYDANPNTPIGQQNLNSNDLVTLKSNSLSFIIWPAPLNAIIELAIISGLVLALLWLMRKLRWRRQVVKKWQYYTVSPGENIQTISRKFGVSVRKLAKANRLKPPYLLSQGAQLKVPTNLVPVKPPGRRQTTPPNPPINFRSPPPKPSKPLKPPKLQF